jgi:hypothetical protein
LDQFTSGSEKKIKGIPEIAQKGMVDIAWYQPFLAIISGVGFIDATNFAWKIPPTSRETHDIP